MSELSKRLSIGPIIAEYDEKTANASKAIANLDKAILQLETASTIQGTFGGGNMRSCSSPDERSVLKSLRVSAWRYLYMGLNIKNVAPASDRSIFERTIEDPPEFTMDNIRASFGEYIKDPRHHILRGLAEAFCNLDESYKSHAKVKIGVEGLPKRVILTSCGDSWGWGSQRAVDMVNALRMVQELGTVDYRQIQEIYKSDNDLDGLSFKKFLNGNLHIIFDKRTRLVINRALAEFYGDVLPDAPDPDAKPSASTAVAKDLQYYPTPEGVAARVVEAVYRDDARVLEPSCGCGRLIDALRKENRKARVFGYEVNNGRAEQCRAKGYNVRTGNFLEVPPSPDFDHVIMNPPFYGQHYLKHINHAIKFLDEGGLLTSVLPASAWYDHDKLPRGGTWRDLPVASFSESGTNIPTGIWEYRLPRSC